MSILEQIVETKRAEVKERAAAVPLSELEKRVQAAEAPRSLKEALRPGGSPPGRRSRPDGARLQRMRIIAEVKKASPSKGVIREDFDPVSIARAYQSGGAVALSVLTDEPFFQGRLEYLEAIRREVSLPLLRKDFVLDPYQVWEARAAGADAILLILAAVPDDRLLARLAEEAGGLGMEVLWEVHDPGDLRRVLPLEPRMLGINNRDLRTFQVTLETTRALLDGIPGEVVTISESGLFYRADLEKVRAWGVDAFLIGESLMRAPDPGAALKSLVEPGGGG